MKSKIVILAIVLSLMPTVASAKSYHYPRIHSPKPVKISRVIRYSYTFHRPTRVRCPYLGCKSDIQP